MLNTSLAIVGFVVIAQIAGLLFYFAPIIKERMEAFKGAPPQLQTFSNWLNAQGKGDMDIKLSRVGSSELWSANVDGFDYILLKDGKTAVTGEVVDLTSVAYVKRVTDRKPSESDRKLELLKNSLANKVSGGSSGYTKPPAMTIDQAANEQAKIQANKRDFKDSKVAEKSTAKKSQIRKIGYDAEGNLIDPETLKNQVKTIFGNIVNKQDWYVEYPAIGEEKKKIIVFSDYTCGYCRKLHKSLPMLNRSGVTVIHLFYPRAVNQGYESPAAQAVLANMKSAWCSIDQRKALDDLYKGKSIPKASCEENRGLDDFPALEHFVLGNVMNLTGTPLTITEDGKTVGGFSNVAAFLNNL